MDLDELNVRDFLERAVERNADEGGEPTRRVQQVDRSSSSGIERRGQAVTDGLTVEAERVGSGDSRRNASSRTSSGEGCERDMRGSFRIGGAA